MTHDDPREVTLASYDKGIAAYLEDSQLPARPVYARYREQVLSVLHPGATLLELGSGPGTDAAFFEAGGLESAGMVDHQPCAVS